MLSSADSDDYVTWTLEVNPDAVFSDGSKITAEDVVGTWNLSARPATKHARVNLFLGGVAGFDDVILGNALDMTGLAVVGRRHRHGDPVAARPDLRPKDRHGPYSAGQGLAGRRPGRQ